MNKLLELLFPPKCMLCRQLLGEEEEICGECRKKILLNTAPPRAEKGAFFDKAAAGLWYETDVRRAMHRLKYGEKQTYARPLARVMAYTFDHKLQENVDVITFVPTNRSTLRERGYNQAELLARELSEMLNKPCLPMLEKTRETKPMHGLRPEARRANVLGAYRLCCEVSQVSGKRILVADDILTTGATLSECSRMLKMAGADKVFCICAAAARKTSENLEKYSEIDG